MAGAGYKLFNTGDVLTAAQVNTYLQEQVVMVFASAAARTTALSGVLAEGMMSYLTDTDVIQYYNGTSWVTVNTDQTPLTTKGDLFTYSTTDARLAVGTNDQILYADSAQSTGLKWGNPPGLIYTGGSSFSAQSSVSLNNVFSSTYQNYKIFVLISTSSQVVLQYRYRVSGSDNTTANYSNQYLVADNTTVVAGRAQGQTTGDFGQMVLNGLSYFDATVYRPNEVASTGFLSQNGSLVGAGYIRYQVGNKDESTAFDGFTIYPASGTITGTIRVYGIRNS